MVVMRNGVWLARGGRGTTGGEHQVVKAAQDKASPPALRRKTVLRPYRPKAHDAGSASPSVTKKTHKAIFCCYLENSKVPLQIATPRRCCFYLCTNAQPYWPYVSFFLLLLSFFLFLFSFSCSPSPPSLYFFPLFAFSLPPGFSLTTAFEPTQGGIVPRLRTFMIFRRTAEFCRLALNETPPPSEIARNHLPYIPSALNSCTDFGP